MIWDVVAGLVLDLLHLEQVAFLHISYRLGGRLMDLRLYCIRTVFRFFGGEVVKYSFVD
jgi:hypothetical protein